MKYILVMIIGMIVGWAIGYIAKDATRTDKLRQSDREKCIREIQEYCAERTKCEGCKYSYKQFFLNNVSCRLRDMPRYWHSEE